jgi:CBS domain-containing protein/ribosome-associated translation inhibitor RaiA
MADPALTAHDLMTARPVTISPDAPVSTALGLLHSHRIHELPVLQRGKLVGMISMDSIARRTNLALATKVEHLMHLPPLIRESTPLPEIAEQLLGAGLRAAPVVGAKNALVGIVSRTDLVRALPELPGISGFRVEQIATPVRTVLRERESIEDLLGHMRELEEHPLPVLDKDGRLVGAVGVADLGQVLWRPLAPGKQDAVRHRPGRSHGFDVEVGTIMHSPAVTVPEGTSADVAARTMAKEKVSSCFVVADERPVGIVSQGDLLGLAVGRGAPARRAPSTDVYVQIHGLRGGADTETLAEIDRVVAQGLRRVSRSVKPLLLSLHITPHATHRSGEATLQARLHTDRAIYYASNTEWNLYAGINRLMDELGEQVRSSRDANRRQRRSAHDRKEVSLDDNMGDPELEAKLRAMNQDPEE